MTVQREVLSVGRKLLGDEVPVDQLVQKRVHVSGTHVLVVEVVRVLPHVHGEQGHGAFLREGAVGADGLGHLQAGRGPHEPGPAGSEGSRTGVDEFLSVSMSVSVSMSSGGVDE